MLRYCLVTSKLYQRSTSKQPEEISDDGIDERTSLLSDTSDTLDNSDSEAHPPKSVNPDKPHIPSFDLHLSKFCLSIELSCHALIPLFATLALGVYKPAYITLSILSAISVGSGPAAQSLAAELYARRGGTESGKLFGTLSVIQAIWFVWLLPSVSQSEGADENDI